MRLLVYTFLFMLLGLTYLSCEKKVTIPLPPFEKRLVVHGFIAAGDTFKMEVGQTVRHRIPGMLGTAYVDNALVLLYENGVLIDTLRFDPAKKNYASANVMAEIGKPYTIKIEAAGFPSVEATATGPLVPALQSLKHIRKARLDAGGRYLDDVEMTFQDPAGVRNFYIVGIRPANNSGFGCVYSVDPVIERGKSSLLPLDESDCLDPKKVIFSDRSFDGQLKTFSLSGGTNDFIVAPIPDSIPFPTYRPYVKRYAIDSIYYLYYKFTSFLINSDVPAIFTENTEKKGNIINGYGVFSIYDVRTDTIR